MIVFFGFTFLRITVFVGDTESSRIPGLVGSLLPSVLIAILGFMAKKLLDNYSEVDDKTSGDEHIQDFDALVMENFSMLKRSTSLPIKIVSTANNLRPYGDIKTIVDLAILLYPVVLILLC